MTEEMNSVILFKIRNDLKNYIIKNNLKSLVLGISGGIDSAIIAAIVKPICKELNVSLIGMSLPSSSNKECEIIRANNIMNNFCSLQYERNIDSLYQEFLKYYPEDISKIRRGNIKARIRMITLYDMAQATKGLVLSTDNYTEYWLGFWTLHGDVGDYGMIQELFKTEVYELAQYIVDKELKDIESKKALQECIDAVPTDGLGITESDMESIGLPTYKEIDERLRYYLYNKFEPIKDCPIIKRIENTIYKRTGTINHTIKRDSKGDII